MRDLTLALPQQGLGKRKSKSWNMTLQINFLLLVAISLLAVSYVFFVNSLGTKGYEIKKLEQKMTQLEFTQKKLQVEASDLQSITRIRQQSQQLNFVPATNATYIKDADYALK